MLALLTVLTVALFRIPHRLLPLLSVSTFPLLLSSYAAQVRSNARRSRRTIGVGWLRLLRGCSLATCSPAQVMRMVRCACTLSVASDVCRPLSLAYRSARLRWYAFDHARVYDGH